MGELSLKQIANEVRLDIVRMIHLAGSGHPGGSLSCVEMLVALYFDIMNIDPIRPDWSSRDRLVLSKGHAAPALYAVLARRGYFPREELWTLRKLGSILQGHPDMKKTPGVDMSSGSLGQGLSAANGMALAAKIDRKDYYVYVILGDGELEEGQVWEAVMTAAHRRLDNLIAFVDYNRLQIDGTVEEIKSVGRLRNRFESFGWAAYEVDGHSFKEISQAVHFAKSGQLPVAIIAHTVKGKGVSYMEDSVGWHGKAPGKQEYEKALQELQVSGRYWGCELQ